MILWVSSFSSFLEKLFRMFLSLFDWAILCFVNNPIAFNIYRHCVESLFFHVSHTFLVCFLQKPTYDSSFKAELIDQTKRISVFVSSALCIFMCIFMYCQQKVNSDSKMFVNFGSIVVKTCWFSKFVLKNFEKQFRLISMNREQASCLSCFVKISDVSKF